MQGIMMCFRILYFKNEGAKNERKVSEIYGGKIWGRSTDKGISGYHNNLSGIVYVYKVYAVVLGGVASSGIYLLPDVFKECFEDVCTESEVFE